MAKALLINNPENRIFDESVIKFLIDVAKNEIRSGIKAKFLIDVYKSTYGDYVAKRVFRLIRQ